MKRVLSILRRDVRRAMPLVALGVVLLVSAPAEARNVYLNGVKVDGLTNQLFEHCQVRFDQNGDVHIVVQGVKVQVVQQTGVTPVAFARRGTLKRRYFLEVTQRVVGLAQYDVEVVINGRSAARIRSSQPTAPIEVTSYLRPGQNTVLFVASKNLAGGRRSTSPQDFLRVALVRGTVNGDRVYVDNVLATFRRTAADTATGAEEQRVIAH